MDVFSLVAKLTLDSSEYDSNLDKAQGKAGTFGDKLKTAFKVGGAAVATVTTATAAMTTAFVKGAGDVAAYGDNIDKMSQKMGLSAEAYQEWAAVMQHSGTSIESLQAGMKTLANAVENGNDAFERLGIAQEDIEAMNNEDLFAATITALQNVDDETERTYLAGQLLGRGATELGALLNTSAEDTQAMKDRVHELGGVLSDDAVKASARYQDSLQDMQTAFGSLQRGMVSGFLPAISDVMGGLTELFSGGDGMEQITQGIEGIVDGISEAVPRMLEVGSKIILALGEAVTANLPVLIEAGTNAVLTLATGLVEQLPAIVDAGLQVIVSLANGIAENLPELIPTIVDVVLQIVDTLTQPDTLLALVDASIAIILALADGLIDALPQMLEKVPEIVGNLVDALIENAPKLLEAAFNLVVKLAEGIVNNLPLIFKKGVELVGKLVSGIVSLAGKLREKGIELVKKAIEGIKSLWSSLVNAGKEIINKVLSGISSLMGEFVNIGKNIVTGVWNGISGAFNWLWNKVTGFFSGIVDGVLGFLGIHSPSRVFADIGENMALGVGEGWDDEFDAIKKGINSDLDFGTKTIGFEASGVGMSSAAVVNGIAGTAAQDGYNGAKTINLMFPDGTVVARYLLDDLINVARANGTPIANAV